MSTRSPVLFLVFNRPQVTASVFEALRKARPPRLYVAADGPRKSRPEEAARCQEVRRIAAAVDWPCDVKTLYRDENLGCKHAVSTAITWFFEQEPEGIVLEDDCLPDASFFNYCDELLQHHRDDPGVMCISGDNFISAAWQPQDSYYFSRYVHIWGWASWRRAWQHYDVGMHAWNEADKPRWLAEHLPGSALERAYWRRIFDEVSQGRVDTWDYQWFFACRSRNALSCMPRVNLIRNIGFGADATHTVSPSKLANLSASVLPQPLQHPKSVQAQTHADAWTASNVFGIEGRSVASRMQGRLKRWLLRAAALRQA